ncbi:MAG: hypothetical protein ACKOXM_01130, partial [Agromyces sp.]
NVTPLLLIPEDARAADIALARAQPLRTVAARSPLRVSIVDLSEALSGQLIANEPAVPLNRDRHVR